jgi:hypothetical protein
MTKYDLRLRMYWQHISWKQEQSRPTIYIHCQYRTVMFDIPPLSWFRGNIVSISYFQTIWWFRHDIPFILDLVKVNIGSHPPGFLAIWDTEHFYFFLCFLHNKQILLYVEFLERKAKCCLHRMIPKRSFWIVVTNGHNHWHHHLVTFYCSLPCRPVYQE